MYGNYSKNTKLTIINLILGWIQRTDNYFLHCLPQMFTFSIPTTFEYLVWKNYAFRAAAFERPLQPVRLWGSTPLRQIVFSRYAKTRIILVQVGTLKNNNPNVHRDATYWANNICNKPIYIINYIFNVLGWNEDLSLKYSALIQIKKLWGLMGLASKI